MNEILKELDNIAYDAYSNVEEAMLYIDEIKELLERKDIEPYALRCMEKDMQIALTKCEKISDIISQLSLTLATFKRKNL